MATRKPKAAEPEAAAAPAEPVKKPRRAAAKPVEAAAEKPAAKRASKPKVAAPEAAASVAADTIVEAVTAPVAPLTPEERYKRIAEAAYFIAEKRGFAPGNPSDDWYQAEAQVNAAG